MSCEITPTALTSLTSVQTTQEIPNSELIVEGTSWSFSWHETFFLFYVQETLSNLFPCPESNWNQVFLVTRFIGVFTFVIIAQVLWLRLSVVLFLSYLAITLIVPTIGTFLLSLIGQFHGSAHVQANDEARPILLCINQSDSQRYLMRPVQNKLSSQITNSIFSWSDDIFREFWASIILLAFVGQELAVWLFKGYHFAFIKLQPVFTETKRPWSETHVVDTKRKMYLIQGGESGTAPIFFQR